MYNGKIEWWWIEPLGNLALTRLLGKTYNPELKEVAYD